MIYLGLGNWIGCPNGFIDPIFYLWDSEESDIKLKQNKYNFPAFTMSNEFYHRVENLFLTMEEQTGLSRHRLLIELGLDPTQFRAYKKAGRALSNPMLAAIAKSSWCPYPLTTLLAWKAIHEYGEDVIEAALKVVKQDKKAVKS